MMKFMLFVALVLFLALPVAMNRFGLKGKMLKSASVVCSSLYFLVLVGITVTLLSGSVMAAPEAAEAAESAAASGITDKSLGLLAAALVTGLATIGAGIAVASSASAALGAVSEDSGMLGKSLIFVSLAEGIALYGLLVTFIILGRL